MRRQIRWTEKLPDGTKRDVRVAVSKREVKWQFKCSDAERWDYDSPPSRADWDRLEDAVARRGQRGQTDGNCELQTVRRLRDRQFGSARP